MSSCVPGRPKGDERAVANCRSSVYGGNAYGFGQSQLLWDLRTEPGVLSAFEKLWGTSELVVSFDGGSLCWAL